jgi:hypothetical protein
VAPVTQNQKEQMISHRPQDAENYETKVIPPLPGPLSFSSDDLPTPVTYGVAPFFFLFSTIQKPRTLFYLFLTWIRGREVGVFFSSLKFEKPVEGHVRLILSRCKRHGFSVFPSPHHMHRTAK